MKLCDLVPAGAKSCWLSIYRFDMHMAKQSYVKEILHISVIVGYPAKCILCSSSVGMGSS